MVFHYCPGYAVTKDLTKVVDEVLRCDGAVLVLVLRISEGRVDEELDEAAELLLAESLRRADSNQRLEKLLFQT